MLPDREADLSVAGLAHDLNNVFETISEAAELLATDSKWAKLAATIQRSVDRGSRIVDSMAENAREAMEFNEILNNAIAHAQDFLRTALKLELEFKHKVEPGIRLPGSSAGWERVLVNLFLNAAQVMQDDRVVDIECSRRESHIEIRVADNGPGIQPEILPRIFEPNFSTKTVRTRKLRSGLGLHIVKSIVEQNGGTVEAANRRAHRGAEFRIRLPLN